MNTWSEWLEEPDVIPCVGPVRLALRDPALWAARYHDAALASIAEAQLATPEAVRTLTQLSAEAPSEDPMRFGDDWVEASPPRRYYGAADERAEHVEALLTAAGAPNLATSLAKLAGETDGPALELGSGAGELSVLLAKRPGRLVVGDLSLRAVLRSLRGLGEGVFGAVIDAEDLTPIKDEAFGLVAAMNLVDLLDSPVAGLAEAHRVLRPGGRLVLSTPHPELGSPTHHPELLVRLLEELGFEIETVMDGVPWVRDHGREVQVFLCQLVSAIRRKAPPEWPLD